MGRVSRLELCLKIGNLTAVGQAFNRHHFGTIRLYGQHQAAANCRTIDPHGAGTADPVFAGKVRPREIEIEAQKIDKMTTHRNGFRDGHPVDGKLYIGCFFRHEIIFASPNSEEKTRVLIPSNGVKHSDIKL